MITPELKTKLRSIEDGNASIAWHPNMKQLRRAWESWTETYVGGPGVTWESMKADLIRDMGNLAAWEYIRSQSNDTHEYTYMEWSACVDRLSKYEENKWFKPNHNQWIFACSHAEPNSSRTTLSFEQCKEYFAK